MSTAEAQISVNTNLQKQDLSNLVSGWKTSVKKIKNFTRRDGKRNEWKKCRLSVRPLTAPAKLDLMPHRMKWQHENTARKSDHCTRVRNLMKIDARGCCECLQISSKQRNRDLKFFFAFSWFFFLKYASWIEYNVKIHFLMQSTFLT